MEIRNKTEAKTLSFIRRVERANSLTVGNVHPFIIQAYRILIIKTVMKGKSGSPHEILNVTPEGKIS